MAFGNINLSYADTKMKTTREEVGSWIRRQQKKKTPNVIYIRWLKQQQIKLTTTAKVKQHDS